MARGIKPLVRDWSVDVKPPQGGSLHEGRQKGDKHERQEETFYKRKDANPDMERQSENKKGKNVIELQDGIDTDMIKNYGECLRKIRGYCIDKKINNENDIERDH